MKVSELIKELRQHQECTVDKEVLIWDDDSSQYRGINSTNQSNQEGAIIINGDCVD